MNNLKDLTLEQLIELYDNCIGAHEQHVSDECFRRYGVSLADGNKSWWDRNGFFTGIVVGLVLSIVIRFTIAFIEHYQ